MQGKFWLLLRLLQCLHRFLPQTQLSILWSWWRRNVLLWPWQLQSGFDLPDSTWCSELLWILPTLISLRALEFIVSKVLRWRRELLVDYLTLSCKSLVLVLTCLLHYCLVFTSWLYYIPWYQHIVYLVKRVTGIHNLPSGPSRGI